MQCISYCALQITSEPSEVSAFTGQGHISQLILMMDGLLIYHHLHMVVQVTPLDFSRAHRTAAFLRPRPGIDHCFPYMALGALPPDFSVAPQSHHFRRQRSIQRGVPLRSYFGFQCGKIIEAGQDFLACAVWAAAAVHRAGTHCRRIDMPQFTPPPHLLVRARRYGFREQDPVLFPVPLGSNLRKAAGKIVLTGNNASTRAHRTASPRGPGGDRRLPLMAVLAPPPHLSSRAGHHILRRQFAVFCWMPLADQLRMGGCQIVFTGRKSPVGTIRTGASHCAGHDHGTPFMSFLTDPPDCFMAAGNHLIRR